MSAQFSDAPNDSRAFIDDDRDDQLNADFTRTVSVDTRQLPWQPSPAQGVTRKRLEVIGAQNPQLTTIVRFDAGSRFARHGHPGGEEFFVLAGTFSDHSGDFPAGSYVRNPRGWAHAPWTDQGCELFVKLCQFQSDDTQRVVIDSDTAVWQAKSEPGLWSTLLHRHGDERVELIDLGANSRDLQHDCLQSTELLLLAGEASLSSDGFTGKVREGHWLRLPAGSRLQLSSVEGCRLYCKSTAPRS